MAIASIDDQFYSPINGEKNMVFYSKHVLGMKMEERQELLLHIGIDAVVLNGGSKVYEENSS